MREVLNAKDKRETIKRYIAANSELSNRKIAKYWDVGATTIRRYRKQLGIAPLGAQNGQKVRQVAHPETDNLPVVLNSNGQPYDEVKIKLCIQQTMKGIAMLEKPINYLHSFRMFQLIDALITENQYLRNLNLYQETLEDSLHFYREIINERDSYL